MKERSVLLALAIALTSVLGQDVTWQYPTRDRTFNYNDVIVASWTSTYAYPEFYVWGPSADGTTTIQYLNTPTIWTNGSFAYAFSSTSGGCTTYPYLGHFQILYNATSTDGVDSNIFTITSTAGSPTTFAYSTTTAATSTSSATSSQATPSSIESFKYVGCWTDNAQDRTLQNNVASSTFLGGGSNMTVANCFEACTANSQQNDYTILGVENGQQCFCGTGIWNPASYGTLSKDCNVPCSGDASVACGGVNRLALYAVGGTLAPFSTSVDEVITSTAGSAASTMASTATTTGSSISGTGSNSASPASSPTQTSAAGLAAGTSTTTVTQTSSASKSLGTAAATASTSLSTGAKAGIGVGIAAAVVLGLVGLVWFMLRHRRSRPISNATGQGLASRDEKTAGYQAMRVHEMEQPHHELPERGFYHELPIDR